MEKINVAFYSDTYLPAVDGVVTSMLNFKKELERRGHVVYIFASGDSTSKSRYSTGTVFITRGVRFTPYPQYKVALFPLPSMLRLNSLGTNIVHVQTPFSMGFAGMISAKLQNYPLVGSFHTLITNRAIAESYYPKNRMLKRLTARYLWKYSRFFYRNCNTTIVPTNTVGRILNRHGIKNLCIVPNSVDTKEFNTGVDGSLIRKRFRIKENEKLVLYVGRASREKRIEILLKAAKILSRKDGRIKFVIGGTGPALDYYKRTANRLGLYDTVRFIGFVDQKELPELYASCDAFCIPSTFETQGIVALEAMATGKPVVGADYLALRELIRNNGNGEKFRPGDYISCAKKIEKVLNNSETYRKEAIETAKSFSIEKATDKLLEVYKPLLSNKQ
jgi:1,2-diacylglycerol 3-alpha-glucosyltransferase